MTSCARRRRGLAHNNCNVIIGMASEDWDLLATIAANGSGLAGQVRQLERLSKTNRRPTLHGEH